MKANGIIAQQAKGPPECNHCLELEEILVQKESRISTMIHNIQKYLKENGLMKAFLKEIL
jgi:hypothetical protein